MRAEDWLPIETAEHMKRHGKPRWDQPLVFLWAAGRAYVGKWEPDTYNKKPKSHWYISELGISRSRENQPTHWMEIIPPESRRMTTRIGEHEIIGADRPD